MAEKVSLYKHAAELHLTKRSDPAAASELLEKATELQPGDRYFSASPFFHVAGMGMALVALSAGVTVLPCPGFSLAEWERLKQYRPTHAQLVPTMIDMLLAAGAAVLVWPLRNRSA